MLDVAQSIRRLSGAPFVASAVFLPQRVQFLSSLDGGSVELDAAKDTLWLCQNSYWKWPFIVDFPIENGDFP